MELDARVYLDRCIRENDNSDKGKHQKKYTDGKTFIVFLGQ